jgi:hypothetical protein
MLTEKLPDAEVPAPGGGAPREIGQGPWIAPGEARGPHVAERAGDPGGGRGHGQGELGGCVLAVPRRQGEPRLLRYEAGEKSQS